MLSNLFIDTDVILDVLLNREEHYNNSAAIFKCFENNIVQLYTSPTVIINTHYIGQKQLSKEKCRSGIKYLLSYFNIIEASKSAIIQAYNSEFSDIEDAIQYFTAINAGIIDCLNTRNIKDYKNANQNLPVLSPAQFIKLLSK